MKTENPATIAPQATISDFASIAKKGPMANMADEPDIPRTVDALNAAVVYPQRITQSIFSLSRVKTSTA